MEQKAESIFYTGTSLPSIEAKDLQKELEWKTMQLQDYVDNAAIGLHWVDAEGIIKWANKAELDMLGYSEEEYIGHHISEFHVQQEKISDILQRLSCNETLDQYESELRCKDGSIKTVHISSNVFRYKGEFMHTRCFTIDVTEKQKLFIELQEKNRELLALQEKKIQENTRDLQIKNEQLKMSEERYHKMIEEVEDYAIILLDSGGLVQNWNKGAEKIKGYKEDEIVGESFNQFYLPEDRLAGLPEKILNEARQRGKALYEGWRMRKDGSHFWGSIVLTALHDENNNVIGFSKVTRDLTAKKMAEDKMREYSAQLEFKNRELEQFAYAASHDMKEPLRKILFYSNAVSERLKGKTDEKTAEYLERSVAAASRMQRLIEDLLSYAMATKTKENLKR